jgi:hypothetical protein
MAHTLAHKPRCLRLDVCGLQSTFGDCRPHVHLGMLTWNIHIGSIHIG